MSATALRMEFAHESTLSRPSCPRCGQRCYVPENTTFTDQQIRHAWACAECDYRFESVVML